MENQLDCSPKSLSEWEVGPELLGSEVIGTATHMQAKVIAWITQAIMSENFQKGVDSGKNFLIEVERDDFEMRLEFEPHPGEGYMVLVKYCEFYLSELGQRKLAGAENV